MKLGYHIDWGWVERKILYGYLVRIQMPWNWKEVENHRVPIDFVFSLEKKAWIEEISITLHFPWGMSLDGQVLGFRESLREMVYRCLLFFFLTNLGMYWKYWTNMNQYFPVLPISSHVATIQLGLKEVGGGGRGEFPLLGWSRCGGGWAVGFQKGVMRHDL